MKKYQKFPYCVFNLAHTIFFLKIRNNSNEKVRKVKRREERGRMLRSNECPKDEGTWLCEGPMDEGELLREGPVDEGNFVARVFDEKIALEYVRTYLTLVFQCRILDLINVALALVFSQ
jgi:hypothetical protein